MLSTTLGLATSPGLRRGVFSRNKINLNWTGKLAYIVGIIATDGNLSPDLRHVVITSKDEQLLLDIKVALKLTSKIGKKSNGKSKEKKYFVLQIGDKRFYNFLYSIGLTRRKSLTIKRVNVPKKYFSHFCEVALMVMGILTCLVTRSRKIFN